MMDVCRGFFPYVALPIAAACGASCPECDAAEAKECLPGIQVIKYRSSADASLQPALWHAPKTGGPAPLLVGLHTWSGDYMQGARGAYARHCVDKGWVFIHPDFRGPNCRPEATGSELAVKDIVSAVDYAKRNANVDPKRVYLVGASGGGYAALLMAGRHPELWTAVSAWVPISDLRAWYVECTEAKRGYAGQVVKSCGGPPGHSPEVDEEYKKRSAITYLAAAVGLPLDINAGIQDGHTGSVPVSHSLLAFNQVAKPEDRLSEEEVRHFTAKAEVPPHLQASVTDPTYGKKKPLFRRTSGAARVTIFDGGHQIVARAALTWLAQQRQQ